MRCISCGALPADSVDRTGMKSVSVNSQVAVVKLVTRMLVLGK